jgi:MFS family permease
MAYRHRWLILTAAFLAFFVSCLDRLAWASASEFADSVGGPVATLGWFTTAFYIGYVVTSATSGFAADRWGPRRMLVLALTSLALATGLFGLSGSWREALVVQGLMGACAGADYAACVKLVAVCFERFERGRAFGLLMTAPSIGIAVARDRTDGQR